MMSFWSSVADVWVHLLPWLAAFAVVFSVLAKLMPCNTAQPLWRKEILTDVLYFFILPVLNRFAVTVFLGAGIFFLFYGEEKNAMQYIRDGYGPLATLPIWLQVAIVFLISDVLLYWLHRWFHGKRMWRFHAIHHSSQHVDWLSTYRFHPVNSWLSFSFVDALMMLIGFSPAAVVALAGFNTIYSAMVHANLNWTFGPFRYLFASPVFHRWHHTAQEEGMDKNFAPTIPLLDVVFGTFYMPEQKKPERYGVPGSNIPSQFIGQMLWPFRKTH
jgi:sterol desaturase/sphingolipid hydroxylase (fatty acid hydroxylase superfamily)